MRVEMVKLSVSGRIAKGMGAEIKATLLERHEGSSRKKTVPVTHKEIHIRLLLLCEKRS